MTVDSIFLGGARIPPGRFQGGQEQGQSQIGEMLCGCRRSQDLRRGLSPVPAGRTGAGAPYLTLLSPKPLQESVVVLILLRENELR